SKRHGQGDNAGGGIDGFAPRYRGSRKRPVPRASPNRQRTAFPAASHDPSAAAITQSCPAQTRGDHRTSSAPETLETKCNKHGRARRISRKINASDTFPAAHNGLVGGSNPPGPTRQSEVCGDFLAAPI